MERVIRNQLLCMAGVMVGLLGLGAWGYDFIIDGIMAKPALNIPIFIIFFAAAGLAIRTVYKLKNEVLAMQALQVDYSPHRRGAKRDPYNTPGIVFFEPSLLGNAYRLITEELTKVGRIQIPTNTVQAIITSIDHRISEKKSLIAYFGNLLVFLGLLGAFMGLMKTVGSVGDLIGGMDLSGGGGDSAFAALIEGMKQPLNGMSVGFSSSLFGLGTSLVLGAYERFMQTAMKELRNEFETWLTNIAQLEGGSNDEAVQQATTSPELAFDAALERLGSVELRLAQATRLSEQTANSVGRMAASVEALVKTLASRDDEARQASLMALSDQIASAQRDATLQVTALISAQAAGREETNTLLERLADTVERLHDPRRAEAARFDTLELPDLEAPSDEAQGARGLLGRLAASYGQQRSRSEVKKYRALVQDVAKASAIAHQSIETVLARVEKGRHADRRALLGQAAAHRELAGAVAVLSRRVTDLIGTVENRATAGDDTLVQELRDTRLALDSSLIALAHRVEDQKKSTLAYASATHEAVEAAVRRAVNG